MARLTTGTFHCSGRLALFLRRWFAPKVRSFARTGVQGMAARASKVTRFVNQILQVAERHFSRTDHPETFVEEVLRCGREFAGCKALDGRAGKINRSQPFIKVALPSLIRRLKLNARIRRSYERVALHLAEIRFIV